MRLRSGLPAAPAVVACVLLVAGCASMPSSGPVLNAENVSGGEQPDVGSVIRVIPKPPQPGMQPQEIVRGFLDAMNSVEPDFAVSRQYLAEPDEWDPGAGVVVYAVDSRKVIKDESGGFEFTGTRIGDVDSRGAYRAASPPDTTVTERFTVVQVRDDVWRIEKPPPGVLVSNVDFNREYVGADGAIPLYFFDPRYRVLVPDPIYLPKRQPDLITTVTQAVLRGPTDRLAPAVTSAVPAGTKLATTPVLVEDGVVKVELDLDQAVLPGAQQERLAAQLAWSLSALSIGNKILVTAGGRPLSGLASKPTTSADWPGYRPTGPSTPAKPGYLLQDQVLATFGADPSGNPTPILGGTAGAEPEPLAAYAVSPRTGDIAGISPNRTKLVRIPQQGSRRPVPLQDGTAFASPTWDGSDRLWVLDQQESGSRVFYFDEDGRSHAVTVAGLGERRITKLAVSDDGTRIALITRQDPGDERLDLGLVNTGPGASPDTPPRSSRPLSITNLETVAPQLERALDVAWADPQQLVVLIEKDGDIQLYQVGVDGRMAEQLGTVGSDADPNAVAASPGLPILVGTKNDEIWQLAPPASPTGPRFWERLQLEGQDPAYPG